MKVLPSLITAVHYLFDYLGRKTLFIIFLPVKYRYSIERRTDMPDLDSGALTLKPGALDWDFFFSSRQVCG